MKHLPADRGAQSTESEFSMNDCVNRYVTDDFASNAVHEESAASYRRRWQIVGLDEHSPFGSPRRWLLMLPTFLHNGSVNLFGIR